MFRLSYLISCTSVESTRNAVVQRSEMCRTCHNQQHQTFFNIAIWLISQQAGRLSQYDTAHSSKAKIMTMIELRNVSSYYEWLHSPDKFLTFHQVHRSHLWERSSCRRVRDK